MPMMHEIKNNELKSIISQAMQFRQDIHTAQLNAWVSLNYPLFAVYQNDI